MITTLSAAGQAALEKVRAIDMGPFFGKSASDQALVDFGAPLIEHTEFKDAKVH